MKIQKTKKGFTLIELLVVITIIGILATGAVWIYTSQIQKARDTTRITDMSALKWALEQAFSDMSMYPGSASTQATTTTCDASGGVTAHGIYCVVKLWFLNSLPKDPKNASLWNGSPLIYTYGYADVSWVVNQAYEVSTWVESDWLKTSKAANTIDGWNDNNRIEFWTLEGKTTAWVASPIDTCLNGSTACTWNSVNTVPTTTTSCTKQWNAILVAWDCN